MVTMNGARRRVRAALDGLRGRPTRVWSDMPAITWREQRDLPATAHFAPTDRPRVSILVPVYGEAAMTMNCLRSLTAVVTSYPFEVLVLDDATPKEDMSSLQTVRGLRYLRADVNRGFLRNCNWGAQQARGDILLFLNNDTIVDPDFLDPLVETLDEPTVGAVGSMLLYPGGIVQEAGGILWNDASGWNYGRHDPEDDSRNQWRRDVDFCSGASLAVRRELFDRLGGFDERFVPAYYEDADLCFGVRSLGYRVVYQPRSRVVHLEGVSHGTDVTTGVKAYQVANQQKFAEKWATELATHQRSDIDNLLRARVRHDGPRILVADHIFPEPNHDAGSVRMAEMVELLHGMGFLVHFLPMSAKASGPLLERWQAMGIEVWYGTEHDLGDIIRQLGPTLDVALFSRPHVAARFYFDVRWMAPHVRVVYDMVDAHGLRQSRQAELTGDEVAARAAAATHRFEAGLCMGADAVIAVSQEEADLFADAVEGSGSMHILPLIHTPESDVPGLDGREGVMFVGGYRHPPNADAATWFLESIRPQMTHPEVPTVIAGSHPTEKILAMASDSVHVPGWLEDLGPLYHSTRVVIGPLRFGAGVKGKIVEAMAHGVPVVTTGIGAEGLGLVDGENALIADDAAGFAAAVDRLLSDDDLWHRLAANAVRHVEERFSPESAGRALREVLAALQVPVPH